MEIFNSSLYLQWIWDKTDETVISAFWLEAAHRMKKKKRHRGNHAVTAIELTQRSSDAARGVYAAPHC